MIVSAEDVEPIEEAALAGAAMAGIINAIAATICGARVAKLPKQDGGVCRMLRVVASKN